MQHCAIPKRVRNDERFSNRTMTDRRRWSCEPEYGSVGLSSPMPYSLATPTGVIQSSSVDPPAASAGAVRIELQLLLMVTCDVSWRISLTASGPTCIISTDVPTPEFWV